MRVKFEGGPMDRKYQDFQNDEREILINAPAPVQWRPHLGIDDYMNQSVEVKRGTYYRSNKRLKNGTWVFKWMGWIE